MINFGGRKKKTTFCVRIFDISPCVSTQILIGELVGCRIWFFIQRLPTLHTFYGPRYPKNKKCLKNVMMMSSSCFQLFLVFGVVVSPKVCSVGTCWMHNLIPHPTSSSDRNLSKNTRKYVENMNKKSSFFFSSSKINKYYFIILTIILFFSLGGPFWVVWTFL